MAAKTFRKLRRRRGIALTGTLIAALALAAGLQALAAVPASALPREQGCEITETCSEEGGGWGGEGGGSGGEEGGGGGEEGGGGSEEGDDEPEPSQGEVEEKEISDWENEEIEAREASEEQEAAEREEKELSDRENKELEEKEKDAEEDPLGHLREELEAVTRMSEHCEAFSRQSREASERSDFPTADSLWHVWSNCLDALVLLQEHLAQEERKHGFTPPEPTEPVLPLPEPPGHPPRPRPGPRPQRPAPAPTPSANRVQAFVGQGADGQRHHHARRGKKHP